MRTGKPRRGIHSTVLTAALLAGAAVIGPPAGAAPQDIGVMGGSDEARGSTKTPKRPDTPPDNSIMAPPLPGYILMFILGGAVVALNLWSSKRTQLD